MKMFNITNDDWPEVEAVAKHLGRDCVSCDLFGHRAAVCPRKKPFDKQFNIVKTDQRLVVLMFMEDINYTPSVIAGNTYVCQLDGLESYYLVDVLEVTNEYIRVNYHVFSDKELTKEWHSKIHNVVWMKGQVDIVSFRKVNP